jgi:intracellular septation protein
MPLVSAVVVFAFGGLTLYLQDETFIKLKPTIIYVLFAAVLFGGLFFGHSLLAMVLDSVFHLDDEGWRKLTLRWALFFVAMAVVNELVWRNFSTDAWVTFKTFGFLPLTVLFAVAQTPLLMRHAVEQKSGS